MTTSIRQMSANRNKVVKFFSKGFLPDEPIAENSSLAGATLPASSTWFWRQTPEQLHAAREQLGQLIAEDPTASWLGLYQIEADLAAMLQREASDFALRQLANRLRRWLKDNLTPEGLYFGPGIGAPNLLPCLVRLRWGLHKLAWPSSCETAWQNMLGATYRLVNENSWIFGSSSGPSKHYRQMLLACCKSAPGSEWANVQSWFWGESGLRKRRQSPEPSLQSDDGRLAILRRDWSNHPTLLACQYDDRQMQMLWQVLGLALLSGEWHTTLLIDNEQPPVQQAWQSICWYTDQDGDYLELSLSLEGDVLLERQIFLARAAHVLLMMDTVKTAQPCSIQLRWELPTTGIESLQSNDASRALDAVGPSFPIRLLPLAQPADPREVTGCRVELNDRRLCYEHRQTTSRLFLPMAWVWHPRKLLAQQHWRPLTVTNDRRLVDPQEAVALRIPVEDQQVVFFRAQKEQLRYAFLGHQTLSECVVGSLDSAGDLQQWLIVE